MNEFDLDYVVNVDIYLRDNRAVVTCLGDKYYKITANGIASGYPRLISSDFPGVPDNLDAAVHFVSLGTNDNARTYFFKVRKYEI